MKSKKSVYVKVKKKTTNIKTISIKEISGGKIRKSVKNPNKLIKLLSQLIYVTWTCFIHGLIKPSKNILKKIQSYEKLKQIPDPDESLLVVFTFGFFKSPF